MLVIVATLLSVSAASLRGLHASQTTRAVAEHFMSVCKQTRTRAIVEATIYHVHIDPAQRHYWVSRSGDEGFEPVESEWARRFELDERFELVVGTTAMHGGAMAMEGGVVRLDFFPDGRSQPFVVRFESRDDRVVVARPSVSEAIRIE